MCLLLFFKLLFKSILSLSTSKIKTPFAAFCKIILACENKDSLIPLKKGRNDWRNLSIFSLIIGIKVWIHSNG